MISSCLPFKNAISTAETEIIRQALSVTSDKFTSDLTTRLVGLLSRFQCRDIPTPSQLRSLLIQVARFEFEVKPMTAVNSINSGIPKEHKHFWKVMSVRMLYDIYEMLTASKVVA